MIQCEAKEREMLEKQPIIRIEGSNGAVYYPRYAKNTKGKWELKDKSFREILALHTTSGKPAEEKEKA